MRHMLSYLYAIYSCQSRLSTDHARFIAVRIELFEVAILTVSYKPTDAIVLFVRIKLLIAFSTRVENITGKIENQK